MRRIVIASLSVSALALLPAMALAQDVVIEPEVETWVMEQPDTSVTVEGDVVVGGVLPDTVQIIEVPKHEKYRFAVINKKRVLVDAGTRKVIRVY
jgi:hypothetical protein